MSRLRGGRYKSRWLKLSLVHPGHPNEANNCRQVVSGLLISGFVDRGDYKWSVLPLMLNHVHFQQRRIALPGKVLAGTAIDLD
ncbi:MAG: hypothetical protein SCK70_02435 [bacterium]|nr:hypothetical protein [bacterium]